MTDLLRRVQPFVTPYLARKIQQHKNIKLKGSAQFLDPIFIWTKCRDFFCQRGDLGKNLMIKQLEILRGGPLPPNKSLKCIYTQTTLTYFDDSLKTRCC